MITLIVWSILNGMLFDCDPNTLEQGIRAIMTLICVVSDLHLIVNILKST